MMNTPPTLILLLLDQHLIAWLALTDGVPRDQPIESERGWIPCHSADELVQGLDDLRIRLSAELGTNFDLELLHDDASRALLTTALPKLAPRLAVCAWQIRRWEPLAARCVLHRDVSARPTSDWIAQFVLPLLLASDNVSARQQMQEATQREHASLTGQLQAERAQLQRDNDTLHAQNKVLRRVDAEQLIVYLPALFPRIFTEIGGQDLALLTGRPEPYALPNPYPEPSPEILHTLQRDFRALPTELQRQIVAFVTRLPQRQKLKPRPEMRELVLDLERE
jgi:hypothetical protein